MMPWFGEVRPENAGTGPVYFGGTCQPRGRPKWQPQLAAAFASAYFFSAASSTFLQTGASLSVCLARQAMIRPPPGTTLLQYFS
jgi:hypothetical protein